MTENKSFGHQKKDKTTYSGVNVSSPLKERGVGPDELLRSLAT